MFVAATTRASNLMGRDSPTRSISRSCSARRSLACSDMLISATSSMNSVPAVRQLEASDPAGDGAGERALGVAEQLGLGQRLGNGGGVEGDESLVGTRAVVVDRPRDEFLAGAGLALDQHGAVHRRDQLEALEHLLHRAALADDVVEAVAIAQLRPQFGVLLPQARLVDGGRQHARQLRQLHRLDEEVDGAALDGRHGFFDTAEPGHHDRDDFRDTASSRRSGCRGRRRRAA